MDNRAVWVDIETTGLDAVTDPPIEVGLIITDIWGGVLAEKSTVIFEEGKLYHDAVVRGRGHPVVDEMHIASGLWKELPEGVSRNVAAQMMLDFLDENDVKFGELPMVGSSVQFDRERIAIHMPKLAEHFHYRNVDISTVKELCMRLNPELYARLGSVWEAQKKHRVLDDIMDSINEYKFYYENFLFVGDDVRA